MERSTSKLVRARVGGALATASALLLPASCGSREIGGARTTSDDSLLTPSPTAGARASYVASVQATSGKDYAFTLSGAGAARAHNDAQRFDVAMGAHPTLDLETGDHLSLRVSGFGCAHDVRPLLGDSPVVVDGNRAEYRRRTSREQLTEWYVHGRLGLEHGFTVERDLGCGEAPTAIELGFGGTLSASAAVDGSVVLVDGRGHTVARYGELYANDAAGRALPARLVVDGATVRILFDTADAIYPIRVDPLVAMEEAQLLGSDTQEGDYFGAGVALSGDTAVVNSTSKKAVYVFVRTAGVWTEQAKLVASDGHWLGPVAIDGDTIVAGSAVGDGVNPSPGAVYVFTRAGGVWTEQAKLLASDGAIGDDFGITVGISGDTIVTGAFGSDNRTGSAYVFVRVGNSWFEQAKLLASDGQQGDPVFGDIGDSLGWSVGIFGDTVVLGSPYTNGLLLDSGSIYIFERSGTVWTEQVQLGEETEGYAFGGRVAISSTTILAGSVVTAYAYRRNNDIWGVETTFISADNGSWGGPNVALDGDIAAIDEGHGDSSTTISLFRRLGDGWVEQQQPLPLRGFFGTWTAPIALSGRRLLVGSTGLPEVTNDARTSVFALLLTDGEPCSDGEACIHGYCVNGVCCDTACDGLCLRCTIAEGALMDGVCTGITGGACDDGNACTITDTCDAGACVGAASMSCPPADDCHDNCDPVSGQCIETAKPDETPCDDANACTLVDACAMGVCLGQELVQCPEPKVCHLEGACDPTSGACEYPIATDGTLCPDGVCERGLCVPAAPPYVVGDGCGCHVRGGAPRAAWVTCLLAAAAVRRRRRRSSRVKK